MTLRPCYRASCDAPGCTAAELLPHDRTAACRGELEARGWIAVKHHVQPESPGAPRISYMCPDHRNDRPPGWRSARATAIRQRAGRSRAARGISLVGVLSPTIHLQSAQRAAMLWMLVEAWRSQAEVARLVGITRQRLSQIVLGYEDTLQRRQRGATGWSEPWAKRLRSAGAIP